MAIPEVVVVGHTTSDSTRILVACDARHGDEATIAYRAGGGIEQEAIELEAAPPYRRGVFNLVGLPVSADVEYAVAVGGDPDEARERVESGEGSTFRLLPTHRPLRIGLVSCNGPEPLAAEKKHAPWRKLRSLVEGREVDLLVHAGDQIYADEIWDSRVAKAVEHQLDPDNEDSLHEVTQEYRGIYVRSWSQPAVRDVLSSVPSVMMWDDHEIADGWGSKEIDGSRPRQALFKAAKRAFAEFQAAHGPPRIDGENSFAAGFEHNGVAILLIDARTKRDYHAHDRGVIVGGTQWDSVQKFLDGIQNKSVKRLYVVTGVPVVHIKAAAAEHLADTLRHHARDDLRDSWGSGRNLDEGRSLLLRLFNFMRESPETETTILAGDVHVGTLGSVTSGYPAHNTGEICNPIYQITSSGIGTLPPSGILRGILSSLTGNVHLDLGHSFSGRLMGFAGTGECFLGSRNFAVLSLEDQEGGWSAHGNLTVRFYPEDGQAVRQRLHRMGPRD